MDIEELIEQLKEESDIITKTINNIVKEHTKELDKLVTDINTTLIKVREGDIQEYPFSKLELDFTQITTYIYKINKVMAELGGTSDIAKSKREIAFSKAYLGAKGNTIKEKEALALLEIEQEEIIEKIYDRVLRQLKLTIDTADNIHMALKRMHSARLTELEVFRKEALDE